MGMIMHDDVPYGEGTSYTQGTGIAINNNVIAVDADNTPTENSEKPVKSKGVYSALESNRDESTSLLKSTVGWVGKNLLPNNATSQTINGVTFTVNADGSITANGTATASITNYYIDTAISLKAGIYLISGTPSSIFVYDSTGVRLSNDNYSINVYGDEDGTLFTLNNDTSGLRVDIRIESGTTVNNLTFYPMLRDASITDNTYEPYHESVEEEIEQLTDSVKSINSKLLEIEDFVGYEEDYVLGLQIDYDNSTFKRLGAAVGKTAGTSFNAFNMYGNRKRCTVADNGTINHYYGDSGYAEDGSDGQVMVRQPKFYYRVAPIKTTLQSDGHGYVLNKCNYYISDEPLEGFKLHPAFIDGSGNELDYYLIGAYEGCLYDVSASAYITDDAQVMDNANDKFSSIAGAKPASGLTQDLTRPKIEQMCQNRGSRWHELSMQIASAEQMLMLIEYGHFDMQRAIGKGVVDITDDGTNNMAGTTGSTASLGNTSGRASSTSFTVAGTTTTQTVDGKTSVSYRGVENPYGNIWKFVMGMNVHGNGSQGFGVPYICTDYNYQEAKITDNYVSAGFHLPDGNGGWVKNMGYGNPDLDWAFLPATIGGSNALPVGDYVWGTHNLNEDRIAILGAFWAQAWNAGAFGWNVSNAVGGRYRSLAGRLIRLPEAVV